MYGVVEFVFGLALSLYAVTIDPHDVKFWIAVLSSLVFLVRSIENYKKGQAAAAARGSRRVQPAGSSLADSLPTVAESERDPATPARSDLAPPRTAVEGGGTGRVGFSDPHHIRAE